jgi:hypothetical protein
VLNRGNGGVVIFHKDGRFTSFPIQYDRRLFTILRDGLRNPVRAGLVEQTAQWPWSSLHSESLRARS